MRTVRRTVDMVLPVAGIVLVLGAVLFLWQNLYLQLGIVIVGIFLIEAGIWKLAHPLLPSARRYHALRAEVDQFIELVRRLNAVAAPDATGEATTDPQVAAVRQDMLSSVDRMVACAGRDDLAPPGRSTTTVHPGTQGPAS